MSDWKRTEWLPWEARYYVALRQWDVTGLRPGEPEDDGNRFSVLEELDEESANLIAAAPEMLEVLEALHAEGVAGFAGLGPKGRMVLAKLESVLAKARGAT